MQESDENGDLMKQREFFSSSLLVSRSRGKSNAKGFPLGKDIIAREGRWAEKFDRFSPVYNTSEIGIFSRVQPSKIISILPLLEQTSFFCVPLS